MNLYNLSKEAMDLKSFLETLEVEGEEVPKEAMERFLALSEARSEKIGSLGRIYKEYLAIASAIDTESKELKRRAEVNRNKAAWIKKYLVGCLTDGEKFEDGAVKISWRKSTACELLVSPEDIPDQYCKIEKVPVKSVISEDLMAGANLSFARLVTRNNIQIK